MLVFFINFCIIQATVRNHILQFYQFNNIFPEENCREKKEKKKQKSKDIFEVSNQKSIDWYALKEILLLSQDGFFSYTLSEDQGNCRNEKQRTKMIRKGKIEHISINNRSSIYHIYTNIETRVSVRKSSQNNWHNFFPNYYKKGEGEQLNKKRIFFVFLSFLKKIQSWRKKSTEKITSKWQTRNVKKKIKESRRV